MKLSRAAPRPVIQNLAIAGVFITALVAWVSSAVSHCPWASPGTRAPPSSSALNGLRLLREAAWTNLAEDTV